MKYRAKPVVIDAFRFGFEPIPDWFMDKVTKNEIVLQGEWNFARSAHIKTPMGVFLANRSDYVIRGVTGEVYPCKTEVFEQNYEDCFEGPLELEKVGT